MDIKSLEDEMRSLASRAETVVKNAETTPAEKRAELEKIEADIKSTSSKIEDPGTWTSSPASTRASAPLPARPSSPTSARPRAVKSLGEQLVDATSFRAVQGKSASSRSGPIDLKATLHDPGRFGCGPADPRSTSRA